MRNTLLILGLVMVTAALGACGGNNEPTIPAAQTDGGTTPSINPTPAPQTQATPEPTPLPEPDHPLVGRWRSDRDDLMLLFATDGTGFSVHNGREENFLWNTNDGRLMITSLIAHTQEYFITESETEILFIGGRDRPLTRQATGTGIAGQRWTTIASRVFLTFNADGTGVEGGHVGPLTQPFTWITDNGNVSIFLERAPSGTDTWGTPLWFEESKEHGYYLITDVVLNLGFGILGRVPSIEGDGLIGTWKEVGDFYYTFNSDGTGARTYTGWETQYAFTWSAADGQISIITEHLEDSVDYAISDTTLTIFDRHGADTFTRVGDGR